MTDFLSLVLAIFVADALFEVTKLFVTYLTRSRQRRDSRGRFVAARPGAARSPRA